MAQKATKPKAASAGGSSEVSFPVTGYNGAEFSQEEVTHPQAFGRAYNESNIDAGGFVRDLDIRGFQYAADANLNPNGVKADDFDYLIGIYAFGESHPQIMVLIRNKKSQQLYFSSYGNVIAYDMWLTLAIELITGTGFAPGDEQ